MFPPSLEQFELSVPCDLHDLANLRVGERPTNRAQGQRFDQQFHHTAVTQHMDVRRRVIVHLDHEPKSRFAEDGRHDAV